MLQAAVSLPRLLCEERLHPPPDTPADPDTLLNIGAALRDAPRFRRACAQIHEALASSWVAVDEYVQVRLKKSSLF